MHLYSSSIAQVPAMMLIPLISDNQIHNTQVLKAFITPQVSVEIIFLVTHPIICHVVSKMLDFNCTDICGNTAPGDHSVSSV
jgi:hypothetical protein